MGQIIDRRRNILRRPEDLRVKLHVGHPGFYLIDRCLDITGYLERVAPWILLDDQHQTGAIVYDCITHHPLWSPGEWGHIPEQKLLPVTLGDGNLSERFRGCGRKDVMDGKTLCGCVDEAARSDMRAAGIAQEPDVQRISGFFHDVIERQVEFGEVLRIDLHLQHLQLLTPDRYVGYPTNRKQPRPYLPIG